MKHATELPRRTVNELLLLFKLEPRLRNAFVEGAFDRRFLSFFFDEIRCDVNVYEIDTIECDSTELQRLNLQNNARGRVIRLAYQLTEHCGDDFCNAVCIIDADSELMSSSRRSYPCLLYTDTTSLESFLFNVDLLKKSLHTGIGITHCIDSFFGMVVPILNRLFILRESNISLEWNMKWLCPTKCLHLDGDRFLFDEPEFISRYLGKNSRENNRADFLRQVDEHTKKFNDQRFIRGHDAFDLLKFWLRKIGTKKSFCDHDVLLTLVISATHAADLLEFPLFQQLHEWAVCTD